jgi:hypothetical protein
MAIEYNLVLWVSLFGYNQVFKSVSHIMLIIKEEEVYPKI